MIWESNALLNRRCRAGVGVKVETLLPQKGIHVWTTKLKFLKLNMEVVFSLYQTVTRLRDSKEAPRSSSVTTVSAEAVLTTCPLPHKALGSVATSNPLEFSRTNSQLFCFFPSSPPSPTSFLFLSLYSFFFSLSISSFPHFS